MTWDRSPLLARLDMLVVEKMGVGGGLKRDQVLEASSD